MLWVRSPIALLLLLHFIAEIAAEEGKQTAQKSAHIPSGWNSEITYSQDTRPVLKDVRAPQPSTAIMATSNTSIKMHPGKRSRRSTSITKGTSFTTMFPLQMRQPPYFSQTLLTLDHSSD